MTNHLTLGYLNRNEGYYALNGHSNLPEFPASPAPMATIRISGSAAISQDWATMIQRPVPEP